MRVAIIGAGLGGLALAHHLLDAGVDVRVFERDADVSARFQGYRIGLGEQGVADLRAAVPRRLHPLLTAISGDVTGPGRAVDRHLVELATSPPRDEGLLFDRHVLRHLLLADLDGRVRFGAQLDRYTTQPDGTVRADFTDGTSDTVDLLVGTDGMGSTVRRQLQPSIRITDVGVEGAIGRTPLTERFADLVPGWSTMVSDEQLRLFIGKMPFRQPPHLAAAELAPDVFLPETASYLRWVMLMPSGFSTGLDEVDGYPSEALDAVLELMRDWHPELRAMIEHADLGNSGVGPLKVASTIEPWPSGPVTLLGDSAHPMPPGGLGANIAFRDATLLGGLLADAERGGVELSAAVAAYEREMHGYAAVAREEAMATLSMFDDVRSDA
jgi:2-polyprenyl-6-methoxyphenol hydroxylase-like FAD-dependent oxidoreductase